MTSWRHSNVYSTSYRRHVPTGNLSDNIISPGRGGMSVTSSKATGAPEFYLIEHIRSVTRSLPAHVIRLPRCIPGCSQSISPKVILAAILLPSLEGKCAWTCTLHLWTGKLGTPYFPDAMNAAQYHSSPVKRRDMQIKKKTTKISRLNIQSRVPHSS